LDPKESEGVSEGDEIGFLKRHRGGGGYCLKRRVVGLCHWRWNLDRHMVWIILSLFKNIKTQLDKKILKQK